MSAGQYLNVPDLARTTLDGVVAHFAASTVKLPTRKIIAPGDTRSIAWDCEQTIVTCGGILWGQGPGTGAGTGRQTGNPVSVGTRYTIIVVQIVRCVPEFDGEEPPPADKLTQAGTSLMTDAGLLSQALVELCGRNGPLRDMGAATAGAVEILGPSGGMAGVEGNLTITASKLA